jgi:two-component system OmpR family response regulator
MKILVVDDDPLILDALTVGLALQWQDAEVIPAEDGEAGLAAFYEHAPDVVVLDVNMPRKNGFEVLQEIRRISDAPVIMLTARGEEAAQVRGLELGADDYIVKPFSHLVLLARIKAVLRRVASLPPQRGRPTARRLRFDRWVLDTGRRELEGEDGVAVPLSTGEYLLLVAFLERPRLVLTRDQLLDLTRGRGAGPFDRAIDNQVSRLRRKVEADPRRPRLIKTHWGGGYSLEAEVREA